MPWDSLAWALVVLVLGLAFFRQIGPAAKALLEAVNAQRSIKLEAVMITQIERRNAAELVAANMPEQIALDKARLMLEAIETDAKRRALEADPQAQAKYAARIREIDLAVYDKTTTERARLTLPPDMAALGAKGYDAYLKRADKAPFTPKNPETWFRVRGKRGA